MRNLLIRISYMVIYFKKTYSIKNESTNGKQKVNEFGLLPQKRQLLNQKYFHSDIAYLVSEIAQPMATNFNPLSRCYEPVLQSNAPPYCLPQQHFSQNQGNIPNTVLNAQPRQIIVPQLQHPPVQNLGQQPGGQILPQNVAQVIEPRKKAKKRKMVQECTPTSQPQNISTTLNQRIPESGSITNRKIRRVTKDDPMLRLKDFDPSLAKKICDILEYTGVYKPWDGLSDIGTTKQHQLPDYCNLYNRVKSYLRVFETLKEVISNEIYRVTLYANRCRYYLDEYACMLKKNLKFMVQDLKKVKYSHDPSTKNDYMMKFHMRHCCTNLVVKRYKKLKNWLFNTVRLFSDLFYPNFANRGN